MRSGPAHNPAMSAPIAKAISGKRKNFRFTGDASGIVCDIVGPLYQGRPPNHCLRKGLVPRRCAASGSRHQCLCFKYGQYVRAMFQGWLPRIPKRISWGVPLEIGNRALWGSGDSPG
jgi:hypothetical protein